MGKRKFSVTMHFTEEEYQLFRTWYTSEIFYGALSFLFPSLDAVTKTDKEYRFAKGGVPKYQNVSGDIIECSMEWEEV